MSALIDLTGRRFGLLTVVRRAGTSCGKTTWDVRCECGGTAQVSGLNLKAGNTKSCGCLKRRKGSANPKYMPISPEAKRARRRVGAQVRGFRETVLSRCPVCIRCAAEEDLHVHHIQGFAEFPAHRYDALNGITLCRPCHFAFHAKFGRRAGFTEAQLEGFVDSPIAWLVARHRTNNGRRDLEKARDMLTDLLAMERQ